MGDLGARNSINPAGRTRSCRRPATFGADPREARRPRGHVHGRRREARGKSAPRPTRRSGPAAGAGRARGGGSRRPRRAGSGARRSQIHRERGRGLRRPDVRPRPRHARKLRRDGPRLVRSLDHPVLAGNRAAAAAIRANCRRKRLLVGRLLSREGRDRRGSPRRASPTRPEACGRVSTRGEHPGPARLQRLRLRSGPGVLRSCENDRDPGF